MSALTAEVRSRTTIASASDPSAAAVAASQPLSTCISEAIEPSIESPRESLIRAAPPSRDCEVSCIASNFASIALRSRSAARSASIKLFKFNFAESSVCLATSNSESSPSSPASAPAISISKVEYSRCALCARACASSRAFVKRAISSAMASRRAASDLMWPSWRAVPSRWSAIALIAAAILSSSAFSDASAVASSCVVAANALREFATPARSCASSLRSAAASRSRASGSRPALRASSASSAKNRERS